MREAREEMLQSLNESNLEKMRKASKGAKQTLKMKDGSIGMDSFTASAIMQIYDKVNDKNKKTMENLLKDGKKADIVKLMKFAMSKVNAEYVPEEFEEEFELDEKKQTAQYTDGGQEKITVTVDNMRKIDIDDIVAPKPGRARKWTKVGKKSEFDRARADLRNSTNEEVEEGYKPVKNDHYDVKVTVSDKDVDKVKSFIMNSPQYNRGDIEDVDSDQVDGGGQAFRGKGDIFIQGDDAGSLGVDLQKKFGRKITVMGEEVELDEAKYDLYHKDFSTAMQYAYKMAKKMYGITVDPKEIDDKVASGPKKPSEGKTNSYRLKGDKGAIQVQVYNKGGSKPFELNMYKEEVELGEKLDKEDEPKVKEIIKKLKGASQAHAGQAKDLQKAVTEKDELDEAEAYSPKQIKMAIGIASDPRYKGGNYSGAVKAIEKIKGGLSQHKQVAAVLKRQNEALGENLDGRTREYRQHRERLESLRSKRLEARHIDPADIDTSATDDDIKSADKNIMMQLRKSVSLRGQYSVEFLDKKKVKVPQKIALAVIAKYNSLRKPMDKEKFQAKIAKSHKDLLMGLKESLDEKKKKPVVFKGTPKQIKQQMKNLKKKDKIKIGEESTLDRMNKKLQEKKNG